jgi:hypothetical protein
VKKAVVWRKREQKENWEKRLLAGEENGWKWKVRKIEKGV